MSWPPDDDGDRDEVLRQRRPLRYLSGPFNYAGPDRFDITRKTGDMFGLVFAPSWKLLTPAIATRRAGEETAATWARYVEGYTEEMRRTYRRHRSSWERLLALPRVVAVCYCQISEPRPWCHRRVLGELLAQIGAVDLGEVAGWQDPVPESQLGLFGGEK